MRIRTSWHLLAAACCASAVATFALAESEVFRPGFAQLHARNAIERAFEVVTDESGNVPAPGLGGARAPGDSCNDPIVVTIDGTFSGFQDQTTTCGRGNTIPVNAANCLGAFAGGEDLVYRLDVAQDTCVDILVANLGAPEINFAVVIDDQCVGTPCLYALAQTSGQVLLESVLLPAGPDSLYLVIDSQSGCVTDLQIIIIPAAAPCPVGACCGGTSGCTDNVADVNCFLQGGIYLGDATTCDFATDCNGNGTPDLCDLLNGSSDDCNNNNIPDDCEITPATDADSNGVLDVCDPDCNNDGIPDACELDANLGNCATIYPAVAGTAIDCNFNGIPDWCEGDPSWQQAWDDGIREQAIGFNSTATAYWAGIVSFDVEAGKQTIRGVRIAWPTGAPLTGLTYQAYIWSDPNQDGNPNDAQVLSQGSGVISIQNGTGVPSVFQNVVMPPVTLPVGQKYFVGFIVRTLVGPAFPLPIDSTTNANRSWVIASQTGFTPPIDPNNLGAAYSIPLNTLAGINFPGNLMIRPMGAPLGAACAGACCFGPGGCGDALGENACVAGGGVYLGDGTQCADFAADCNGNGTPDICDILTGNSEDCNGNGIPDECDIALNPLLDVDANGVLDACDPDCNNNGIPDGCDVNAAAGQCATVFPAAGGSADCNFNGVPDECEGTPTWQQQWDDGIRETNLGIAAGADLAAIVSFDVLPGHETIHGLRISWTTSVANGRPFRAFIWSDPNQDGNPNDAQVLREGADVVVQGGPAATATFMDIVLPPLTLPVGTKYFVGYIIRTQPNEFPMAIDRTTPDVGKSWIVGAANFATNPINPNDLGSTGYNIPLNTLTGIGFSGDFLVRSMGALTGPECLPPPFCPGDSNGDGVVNFADISPFIAAIKAGNAGNWTCNLGAGFGPYLNSDANGDNVVNFADISPFIGLLKAPPPPCVSVCP
ncbi:MAG: hypothetical protein IPM18_03650 [Phycisphaerales bacterium]|nr:hypothetical protein [Phycisphaerales bacterium]